MMGAVGLLAPEVVTAVEGRLNSSASASSTISPSSAARPSHLGYSPSPDPPRAESAPAVSPSETSSS